MILLAFEYTLRFYAVYKTIGIFPIRFKFEMNLGEEFKRQNNL